MFRKMNLTKRWFILVGLVLLSVSGVVSAQGDGTLALTPGQPVIAQVEPGGAARYPYNLAQPSLVAFQAMSDSARPVLSVLRDGAPVASQPNDAAQATVLLETFLDAGAYTVEASTRDSAAGTIVLLVQTETPVAVTPLLSGQSLAGAVSPESPLALFSLNALDEPAYLFVEGGLPGQGVDARLVDAETGAEAATIAARLAGARLTIPVGSEKYRLEIAHGSPDGAQPFSLCYVPASLGSCQPGNAAPPPTPAVQPQGDTACRVTPNNANGANLRQTANVNAPIVVAIPAGDSALVSGISPDGTFYNAIYGNWTGWVAAVAVTLGGECGSLAVIAPPALPSTPIPPTATPLPAPTLPPPPTQPSGPCHVVFSADELVYTQPEVSPSYIQDEIPAGGELIPVGRWQNNPSWWKTNYAGAWWLNAPGTAGQVMGDCSGLPLVAWP